MNSIVLENKSLSVKEAESSIKAHCGAQCRSIALRYCTLEEGVIEVLCNAVGLCDQLESLEMVGMELTDNACQSIVKSLSNSAKKTLVELNFDENAAGDLTVSAVCDNLITPHSSAFAVLDLFSNKVSNKGATSLADALTHNASVRIVNLGSNNVGEEGAIAIATMLRRNNTLKELDLTSNKITEDGLWMFAQVMTSSNNSLTSLHLLCNAETQTNIFEVIDTALTNNKDYDCVPFMTFMIGTIQDSTQTPVSVLSKHQDVLKKIASFVLS